MSHFFHEYSEHICSHYIESQSQYYDLLPYNIRPVCSYVFPISLFVSFDVLKPIDNFYDFLDEMAGVVYVPIITPLIIATLLFLALAAFLYSIALMLGLTKTALYGTDNGPATSMIELPLILVGAAFYQCAITSYVVLKSSVSLVTRPIATLSSFVNAIAHDLPMNPASFFTFSGSIANNTLDAKPEIANTP